MTLKRQSTRRFTGLLFAALFALGSTIPAHAGELRCMSDPVVLLSDGTVIDLTATVGTELWNVKSVEYTLRIPAGTFPIAVVRTPNWPTTVETFRIVADQPTGRYDASTIVKTRPRGVDVQARLLVGLSVATKDGRDNQRLHTVVQTSDPAF